MSDRPSPAVRVLDYDPNWPARFEQLAARVRGVLGDLVCEVEHVGSTAVLGLAAKPVIDLDVVVRSAAHLPASIARLVAIGYLHEGDLGIKGREAFRWPLGEERHHLYVLVEGARELERHLSFRDALRSDHALRGRYAELKRALAQQHPHDRVAYGTGKAQFIESVLERARLASPRGRS